VTNPPIAICAIFGPDNGPLVEREAMETVEKVVRVPEGVEREDK
jgi:hypothetical protein